jgi:hypothetical protein
MSDIVLEHGQRILSLDPIGGEKGGFGWKELRSMVVPLHLGLGWLVRRGLVE